MYTTGTSVYTMPLVSETRPGPRLLVSSLTHWRQGTKLVMPLVTKQWNGAANSRIRGTLDRKLPQRLVHHLRLPRNPARHATMLPIQMPALSSTNLDGASATVKLLCIR